jgi:hypothetical protein
MVGSHYNTGHVRVCFKTLSTLFERFNLDFFVICCNFFVICCNFFEYLESYYLTELLMFTVSFSFSELYNAEKMVVEKLICI